MSQPPSDPNSPWNNPPSHNPGTQSWGEPTWGAQAGNPANEGWAAPPAQPNAQPPSPYGSAPYGQEPAAPQPTPLQSGPTYGQQPSYGQQQTGGYRAQTPSAYPGQAAPAYPGQTAPAYAGQAAPQYAGQYGGQYGGMPPQGPPAPPKKSATKWIVVGVVAALAIAAATVVFIVNRDDGNGDATAAGATAPAAKYALADLNVPMQAGEFNAEIRPIDGSPDPAMPIDLNSKDTSLTYSLPGASTAGFLVAVSPGQNLRAEDQFAGDTTVYGDFLCNNDGELACTVQFTDGIAKFAILTTSFPGDDITPTDTQGLADLAQTWLDNAVNLDPVYPTADLTNAGTLELPENIGNWYGSADPVSATPEGVTDHRGYETNGSSRLEALFVPGTNAQNFISVLQDAEVNYGISCGLLEGTLKTVCAVPYADGALVTTDGGNEYLRSDWLAAFTYTLIFTLLHPWAQ